MAKSRTFGNSCGSTGDRGDADQDAYFDSAF